ncbi:MAG: hypothetical protein AVDCRST_MAG90-2326 [uncultured Microvirga sp.]|uniref:Uncharacterized protein n=1 Tax=uncultured Microvirga sp. TaxID=412392 RepID=A0A6J4M3W9_9HYPH|nr:MAG: hypothetical protein AVDCRST_MAG90-2326 [uncultured Microvirga sp.]
MPYWFVAPIQSRQRADGDFGSGVVGLPLTIRSGGVPLALPGRSKALRD